MLHFWFLRTAGPFAPRWRCTLSLASLRSRDQPFLGVEAVDSLSVHLPVFPVQHDGQSVCDIHIALGSRPVLAIAHAALPVDRIDVRIEESPDQWESAPRAAGLIRGHLGLTPPTRDACEASELFCDDLLEDVPIQTKIRYQTLQSSVLLSQLPHSRSSLCPRPAYLFFQRQKLC